MFVEGKHWMVYTLWILVIFNLYQSKKYWNEKRVYSIVTLFLAFGLATAFIVDQLKMFK